MMNPSPAHAGCALTCRAKQRCGDRKRCGGINRQRGFTLLELLLALGLTAMLLTMLSAGVYAVVRDWDNNHEGLEATLEKTIGLLQIERALLGAFPHSFRDQRTLGRLIYFDGEPNRLSWVSTVSPQRDTGLSAWRLYTVAGEGVYLQLAPALSDDPGQRLEAATPTLLLPGYAAEFRYLFEDGDETRNWRRDWDGEDALSLPLAVHVQLTPMDRNRGGASERGTFERETFEIVAGIRATTHRSISPNPLAGR